MLGTPVYLLVAVLVTMVSSARDYRQLATPRAVLGPNEPCTAPGLMCKSCDTVKSCVSKGPANGGIIEFSELDIRKCDGKSSCLNGGCVPNTNPNPFCSPAYDKFECPKLEFGAFPDPANCKISHVCVPKEDDITVTPATDSVLKTLKCADGYGYNPRTKVCDKKLVNNQCPPPPNYPVPLCTDDEQQGALRENPTIYYRCALKGTDSDQVLYPFQQICPHGRTYNNKYGCV